MDTKNDENGNNSKRRLPPIHWVWMLLLTIVFYCVCLYENSGARWLTQRKENPSSLANRKNNIYQPNNMDIGKLNFEKYDQGRPAGRREITLCNETGDETIKKRSITRCFLRSLCTRQCSVGRIKNEYNI